MAALRGTFNYNITKIVEVKKSVQKLNCNLL